MSAPPRQFDPFLVGQPGQKPEPPGPIPPVVFLTVPHYGGLTWPTCAGLLTASFRFHPMITGECGSLLCHVFNRLWAECLNLRVRPDAPRRPTHFAMLHADCAPDPGWLDVLLDEMEATGADILSAVVPIKDARGLTSTGVQDFHDRIRRFTLTEVHQFPETFDAAAAGHPDKALMVNTGCWLARLDRPWVEDFPGFTILDGVQPVGGQRLPVVLSEDWHASRWWHDHGVKVMATRKVGLGHIGQASYRNDKPWGTWPIDKGDGALVPDGEIEGWMSHEELAWLRQQAARRKVVVEVGCWHGRSTKALAESCPGQVLTVDHFQGSPDDKQFSLAEAAANGAGNEARAAFERNLAAELKSRKVSLLVMDSREAARELNCQGYRADMIFLDGAHDTPSVKADITAWQPLLKKGGLLCGHDANDSRVKAALDELLPGWTLAADSIWQYQQAG